MYNNIATKVLTGEVRLSYVSLVTPRVNNKNPNEEPKYSATLLIPKTDTATYQNILASIEAAAVEALNKKWNGVKPPNMPVPIHDGDGVRQDGTPYGDECKGHWVITANSKNKPQVVHQSDINTELLPQDIYSGMYARVTINFFGYSAAGKKGIGCGLGNVMKTRDGDALAGGASAAADFAGIGQTVQGGYDVFPPTPNPGAFSQSTPNPAAFSQPFPGQGYASTQQNPAAYQQNINPSGFQVNPLTGQPMTSYEGMIPDPSYLPY